MSRIQQLITRMQEVTQQYLSPISRLDLDLQPNTKDNKEMDVTGQGDEEEHEELDEGDEERAQEDEGDDGNADNKVEEKDHDKIALCPIVKTLDVSRNALDHLVHSSQGISKLAKAFSNGIIVVLPLGTATR